VRLKPNATTITHHAPDILALKRIANSPAGLANEIVYLLAMQDPRDLLIERDGCGRFVRGFDRALRISAEGIPTFSDPGLLFVQRALIKASQSMPRALLIRHEDFEVRPALVQAAIAGMTGLTFSRSFAKLIERTPEWIEARSRMADEKPSIDEWAAARLVRQFRLAPELFNMLEQSGYARKGQHLWFRRLAAKHPKGMDDTPGTIVGFFTEGTRYEFEARRLAASVDALGLPIHLEKIEAIDDWLSAVRRKPFVMRQLRDKLRGPLLYVDVDAVVHANPWPYLRGYEADVAVAGHRDEQIISGTILFNDTPGATHLLDAWIEAQSANPSAWDQHALQAVSLSDDADRGYQIDFLPPEMCKVFDRRYNPPTEAIIEHLQASRERNADSSDDTLVAQLARRQARIAEIEGGMLPGLPGPAGARPNLPAPQLVDLTPTERDGVIKTPPTDGVSDDMRGASPRNRDAGGFHRAALVAKLLKPDDTVLDLECGQMDLERELPEGARYIPADCVSRDERTLYCELNLGIFPNVAADVVTMLGVLQYCNEPTAVLAAIASRWRRLVITYRPADLDADGDVWPLERGNTIDSAGLVKLAADQGFQLDAIVPCGMHERIYVFNKAPK
jgi:hypothetical protein